MSEVTPEGPPPPDVTWAVLGEHLAWLASVGFFLLVAIKIIRVAGGDPATALGLLKAGGPVSVTFGIVVACLPSIVYAIGYTGVFWTSPPSNPQGLTRGALMGAIWFSSAILFFIGPWPMLLILLASKLVLPRVGAWVARKVVGDLVFPRLGIWMVDRVLPADVEPPSTSRATRLRLWTARKLLRRARAAFEPMSPTQATRILRTSSAELFLWCVWSAGIVPLLVSVLGVGTWLPCERLTVRNSPALVSYVVDVDERWTAVLLHDTRRLQYIATADVETRQVCQVESPWRIPTAWELVRRKGPAARYPTCWR